MRTLHFQNVQDKRDKDGGEICHGWTLSHWANPDFGLYQQEHGAYLDEEDY